MAGLISWIKQVLFPNRCILCDRLLPDTQVDMCPECRMSEMVILNNAWKIPHVKYWVPLWRYSGYVRSSLLRYKFHHRRNYSIVYGRELAQKLKQQNLDFEVITWVPVSRRRKITRGYDQVELLANEVGKHLGMTPVRLLHKHRHNKKQANYGTRAQRIANVKGVYRAVNLDQLKGKRILLLDDIITTGTTVSEAAKTLKAAGAKVIYAASVAASSGSMR